MFFFLFFSDDFIVTLLVKYKEFDEFVYWYFYRFFSDDYDRIKVNFGGEYVDLVERILIYFSFFFVLMGNIL